jgi:RNA recognition motif-containing protein
MKKMYVGNLPFDVTEDQLRQVFAQHGTVESVSVITDRTTGQPRGFGFVEMSEADADKAMRALDGQDLGGRSLKVNAARPREGGGGGGGFRGGNDRGGGRSNRW